MAHQSVSTHLLASCETDEAEEALCVKGRTAGCWGGEGSGAAQSPLEPQRLEQLLKGNLFLRRVPVPRDLGTTAAYYF